MALIFSGFLESTMIAQRLEAVSIMQGSQIKDFVVLYTLRNHSCAFHTFIRAFLKEYIHTLSCKTILLASKYVIVIPIQNLHV